MNCVGFAFIVAVLNCDPMPPPVSDVARFCATYEPVPWRRQLAVVDPKALAAIKRNNAKWTRLCRASRPE
jgi:hypothetical protein